MRWLFVTAAFPWPLDHGTYLRVYHLARALAAAGEDVALLAPAGDEAGRRAYDHAGVAVLDGPPAAPAPTAYRGAHPPDEALARAVAAHARDADVAVLVHARTLRHAPAARAAACVVADLVDDLVIEERRKLRRDRRPLAWLRRVRLLARQRAYENRFVPLVELTTFVSDVDAGAFARRHRGAAVGVVPNGVDAASFAPPPSQDAPSPTVLFVGRLCHPPNADAARHLLGPVASHLRRIAPAARIVIVGDDTPADLHALAGPNDRLAGRVEDVRPYLWDASLVALPMRIGTGVKNKLLEAWAAGKAVVATTLACQGVPAADGENLLVADTPAAMAEAIAAILNDPARRDHLGRRGRRTVLDHLTWPAAATALRRLVDHP